MDKEKKPLTKARQICLIIGITCLLALCIIFPLLSLPSSCNNSEEICQFKTEYESLNGKTNDYEEEYPTVSVDEESSSMVEYVEADKAIDIIKNGTGTIYFGFPECPWCRNLLGPLFNAAKESGTEKIYYCNALDIRDKKYLEDGEIITEKEGTKEYYELVDALAKYLTPYEGLNDENILRLYFPTTVFVNNGKIMKVHIGTVNSHKDPHEKLTEEQYEELRKDLLIGFKLAKNGLGKCDTDFAC